MSRSKVFTQVLLHFFHKINLLLCICYSSCNQTFPQCFFGKLMRFWISSELNYDHISGKLVFPQKILSVFNFLAHKLATGSTSRSLYFRMSQSTNTGAQCCYKKMNPHILTNQNPIFNYCSRNKQ